MTKEYTLGFIFSTNRTRVLLTIKQQPSWQKGKCNGIGGKLYPHESPLQGIILKCYEETGLKITQEKSVTGLITGWDKVGEMHGFEQWKVHVFRAFHDGIENVSGTKNASGELLYWFPVKHLPGNCLTDVHWLIPMCLDDDLIRNTYKMEM